MTKTNNKYEVRVVNVGYGKNQRQVYAVVEKDTGILVDGKFVKYNSFVGDSARNYIFEISQGTSKANSIVKQLNSGAKKVVL